MHVNNTQIHKGMCTHMQTTHTSVQAHTHVNMHTYAHKYTNEHMDTYMNTHTCMHTYIYKYMAVLSSSPTGFIFFVTA
jgi:hypothetical protein